MSFEQISNDNRKPLTEADKLFMFAVSMVRAQAQVIEEMSNEPENY